MKYLGAIIVLIAAIVLAIAYQMDFLDNVISGILLLTMLAGVVIQALAPRLFKD